MTKEWRAHAMPQERAESSWSAVNWSRFLTQSPDILCIFDSEGLFQQVNPAWTRILGFSPEEMQGRTWRDFIHPDDRAASEEIGQRVRAGEFLHHFENRYRHRDGSCRWLQWSVMLAPEEGCFYASARDVTERKQIEQMVEMQMLELSEIRVELEAKQMALLQANEQMEALATTDGLTGLKNHRAFQEFLEQEFQQAMRHDLPLSLALLDVDNFKQYNDAFGHPEGDEVLKTVGRLLREHTRASDFAARYGGEEFVVVLPQTGLREALMLAERLRVVIESADWPHRPITASFGVSTFVLTTQNRAQLIAEADSALYVSKQRGRNGVFPVSSQGAERAVPKVVA